MSLPLTPQLWIFENPFLNSGCHNSMKMGLVSSLMISCQTPSSSVRSLGKFSPGAPWASSLNSHGGGAVSRLPLPGLQVPGATEGHSFWRAELSSLRAMGPSLWVPRGSSGGTDPLGTAVGGFGGGTDPLGTAVGGFGGPALACRSWECRKVSYWRRRELHVHALAQTDLFPAKHIWRLTCLLRFVAFSRRWWVS